MAYVLALLASGRTKGFTAGLLRAAKEGAERVGGVEVEWIHLHKYTFGPCTSCFHCIRDEAHDCIGKDDMGANGALMAKVKRANGWIIADPVHGWGVSAQCHLFIERCYPFVWSGGLQGMPFASISCAGNQGMHRLANQNLCKWAFTHGFRYIGGIPAHVTYLERARKEAEQMGYKLGKAAMVDAEGRKPYPEDERYVDYLEEPWSALEPYLDNLTGGTMAYDTSLIAEGLATFTRPPAKALLEEAKDFFIQALRHYHDGQESAACRQLVKAGALWTHATWKEFLEEEVVKATVPGAYRPLDDSGSGTTH